MEISDQEHNLTHDRDGRYVKISGETSEILQDLTNRWWEIERPLRASIVKCAGCSKHDRDMTYRRKSRAWYCVQCYRRRFS